MESWTTEVAVPGAVTEQPSFSFILLNIIYSIIGLLGIVGNSLVIFVAVRVPSLRSVTNVLICNQTIIDLTSSVFFVVLYLVPKPQVPENEVAASVLCKLWLSDWPLWGFSVSSTVNLVLLTLERYFAIIHPIKYRRKFSMKCAKCLALIPWFVGPLHELGWALVHVVDSNGDCSPKWPSLTLQWVLGVVFFIGHYLMPVTLMVYVYTKIVLRLRRDWRSPPPQAPASASEIGVSYRVEIGPPDIPLPNRSPAPEKKRFNLLASRSVLRTLVIVSVSYIICWGPNEIIYLVYNLGGYVEFNGVYHSLSVIFVLCNMCLNPIIYAFHYEEFRKALRATFSCHVSIPWKRLMCWRMRTTSNHNGPRTQLPSVTSTLQLADTIQT
ncbi:octopamine receptor 1-like [Asterias rubens]|uniref:octopamine receptor 1-like n=1 Tax=Asterias rubens TaxID=7604 RepID=UPI001455A93A|nr:octopamine receptor 1-like [Asterias rubens]